jgi:hypothetical protein
MNLSGSQKYNFEELRNHINDTLLNIQMPDKLYKSVDGILRIINTILITKGDNWASQVLDENRKPLLTPEEQAKFTNVLKPHIESIINFFDSDKMLGGGPLSVTEMTDTAGVAEGIDDVYSTLINRIGNINSTVNNYASKYGILKLEKEHDIDDDVKITPKPVNIAISQGVLGLSTMAGFPIAPPVTMDVLSKIKIPFRTIIFTIYLILDIARLAIGITGPAIGRKIMSILLAILELLKGDWKKAILTIIGYYGMIPMLIGQLFKAFLTLFRMLSPDIQNNIIFGSLDVGKSFIIGILLSIFQVTAPAQIRKPLIDILDKIAKRKAEIDGTLESTSLPERPEYLSPNWNDLNNIQAVLSDKAYICSCEGRQLVAAVNNAAIIRIILEILRIPISEDMITQKCGKEDCKDFVTTVVQEGVDKINKPSVMPSVTPAVMPSVMPSVTPSVTPAVMPSVMPSVTPPLQKDIGVMPTATAKAKEKSKGFLRRGLNEIGSIAQNSLLQSVQGGGTKRIIRATLYKK